MCGILGQLAFGSGAHSHGEEILRRLMASMARRGPDDEGIWSDDRHVNLAFRRLAILDLSRSAHQPMLTADGRYTIVYNGELYNFRELRRELEQTGVRFRSTGDTEVVVYALAHWGSRALARFNGMFALGLYDSVEKRLLLARDHAGIKPLYYALTRDGLVFASQYDVILAHPWTHDLQVSPAGLALYFRLGFIPAPYALLNNTHMLEPGSWLEVFSQTHQVRKGHFFEFPVHRESDLRGEQAREAVDAAVSAAVNRQLVSDVPLGTFLSGGIDSPLVAAKMREAKNGPVRAFTIGTNGDELDESADAMSYARDLAMEHTVEHVSPEGVLEMLDDVVAACGEPFADYSIFPTILVSRLARQHVKVVLSGDGGDELFWGYAGRFASMLENRALARPGERQSGTSHLKKFLSLSQADPRLPKTIGDFYRLKHTHIPEGWLQRIVPDLAPWPDDFSFFVGNDWEPDRVAQWLRWNEFTCHMTMVLLKVDRASMYHSLEVRVPLLDREVVEVATRVDWRSCLDVEHRIGKLPLRYSLARHVGQQTAAKRGFTVPMDAWLRGALRTVFEGALYGRREILGLPVNGEALRAMFDRHLSGQIDYGRGLWVLLSLALWEKHYRT